MHNYEAQECRIDCDAIDGVYRISGIVQNASKALSEHPSILIESTVNKWILSLFFIPFQLSKGSHEGSGRSQVNFRDHPAKMEVTHAKVINFTPIIAHNFLNTHTQIFCHFHFLWLSQGKFISVYTYIHMLRVSDSIRIECAFLHIY